MRSVPGKFTAACLHADCFLDFLFLPSLSSRFVSKAFLLKGSRIRLGFAFSSYQVTMEAKMSSSLITDKPGKGAFNNQKVIELDQDYDLQAKGQQRKGDFFSKRHLEDPLPVGSR